MKKKISVFALILGGVILSSCGTSKQQVAAYPQPTQPSVPAVSEYGKAVAVEPCMELQQLSPGTRAWGNGEHFKLSTASNMAEAQARAKFVRAIATSIEAALKDEASGMSMYSGDDASGRSVTDQASSLNDYVQAVAAGVVKSAVIIKTSIYKKDNNQYNVFVCLEYQKGADQLAEDISLQLQQRIPEEDRTRIKFEHDSFVKSVKGNIEQAGKESAQ